jgi:putative transposase
LKEYDYSQDGGYFVTICTHRREKLFCTDNMQLNEAGEIVRDEWILTEHMRPEIIIDEFVVMPNHLHGIIFRDGGVSESRNFVAAHRCAPCSTSGSPLAKAHHMSPLRRKPGTLGSIIAGFKSKTTLNINICRQTPGCPVWQRNYYEHVIRNERDLDRIRQYIRDNPVRWGNDPENPDLIGKPHSWPWEEDGD